MNKQKAENLRVLIRHMETSVSRVLNMDMMFMDQNERYECQTPACALGEAVFTPELAHLKLPRRAGVLFTDLHGGLFTDKPDRLFGTANHNAWGRAHVTPQEWAIEARKVLAENGYTMDDGFGKFMDKVREPVSLGSYEATLTPR